MFSINLSVAGLSLNVEGIDSVAAAYDLLVKMDLVNLFEAERNIEIESIYIEFCWYCGSVENKKERGKEND